ncbi:MAG: DNRLRE domain-containing protein [Polyangiaceae bacterium]
MNAYRTIPALAVSLLAVVAGCTANDLDLEDEMEETAERAEPVSAGPVADAHVSDCKPTKNYGAQVNLSVDGAPCNDHTLLRFTVSQSDVVSAKLRLYVADGTVNGPKVYRAANGWSEGSVTWNNRPAPQGDLIANLGPLSAGSWVEIDVTSEIDGPGQYTFLLVPDATDGVDFDSREGAHPPQLLVSAPGPGPGKITHVGSTSDYAGNGTVSIARPQSQPGDLLVLFLSRTDDYLPLRLAGWKKAAECFKTGNTQSECLTEAKCTEWKNADYCRTFGSGGNGRDLATVVFYKNVGSGEPNSYTWDLLGEHAAWAILTSLRGAASENPVRSWAGVSNDKSPDSVFPSVQGQAGDMLLLSQGFDDTASQSQFLPPPGTTFYKHTSGVDEAGYVFGKLLTAGGATGKQTTGGPGGPSSKDVLLALTVKPAN